MPEKEIELFSEPLIAPTLSATAPETADLILLKETVDSLPTVTSPTITSALILFRLTLPLTPTERAPVVIVLTAPATPMPEKEIELFSEPLIAPTLNATAPDPVALMLSKETADSLPAVTSPIVTLELTIFFSSTRPLSPTVRAPVVIALSTFSLPIPEKEIELCSEPLMLPTLRTAEPADLILLKETVDSSPRVIFPAETAIPDAL